MTDPERSASVADGALIEQELLAARAVAAAVAADLDEFLQLASHDLQEPARQIQAYSRLLELRGAGRAGQDADAGADIAGQIVAAAQRMESLVRDLVGLYSQVSGLPSMSPVALDGVVAQAVDQLSPVISLEQAKVVVDPLPVVMGDQVLLSRVFENLLKNALAYRSEAAPVIQVSTSVDPAHSGEVVVQVRDNGRGIPEASLDRIFAPFVRIDPEGSRPGSGIGLAACRKIANRLGGRIWAGSSPGEGSTFFVALRAAASGATPLGSPAAASSFPAMLVQVPPGPAVRVTSNTHGETIRLLLIEDTIADARLVVDSLAAHQPERFEVEHVETLAAAVEHLKEGAYDLVLTDLNLPDSAGIATVGSVIAATTLPVVALTVVDDGTSGRSAMSRGAQDYIVKHHVALASLGRTLVHAVDRAVLATRVAQSAAAVRATVAMVAHDIASPLTVIMGAVDIIKKAGDRTLTDVEEQVWTMTDRAARRAAELSRNLMAVTELTDGNIHVDPSEMVVGDVVHAALQSIGTDPSSVIVSGDLDAVVFADRGHLESILSNLATNAHKYGEPPIEVSVRFADGTTSITLRDAGPGVPAEFVPNLFDYLTRAEAVKGKVGGSGLGLWIVRSLAQRNGGEVRYEGDERGAAFTVTLPAAAPM